MVALMKSSGSVHALPLSKAIAAASGVPTKATNEQDFLTESVVLALTVSYNQCDVTLDEMSLPSFLVWYSEWLSMTEAHVLRFVEEKNKLRMSQGKKPRKSRIPMQRLLIELRGSVKVAWDYAGGDDEYVKSLKWYFVLNLFSMAVFKSFGVFKPLSELREEMVAA